MTNTNNKNANGVDFITCENEPNLVQQLLEIIDAKTAAPVLTDDEQKRADVVEVAEAHYDEHTGTVALAVLDKYYPEWDIDDGMDLLDEYIGSFASWGCFIDDHVMAFGDRFQEIDLDLRACFDLEKLAQLYKQQELDGKTKHWVWGEDVDGMIHFFCRPESHDQILK